jgi:hypothetical protein
LAVVLLVAFAWTPPLRGEREARLPSSVWPEAPTVTVRPRPSATLPAISFTEPARLRLGRETFDLLTEADLSRLIGVLESMHRQAVAQADVFRRERGALLERKPANELSRAEREFLHWLPAAMPSTKDRRGLEAMIRLARWAIAAPLAERPAIAARLGEVALAIRNNHRSPAPDYLDLFLVPFLLADYLHNPVGKGRSPAANLQPARGPDALDLSRLDPRPSSFWRRPPPIPAQDLSAGFGRRAVPRLDERPWRYVGPKTSGWNPGCELSDGTRILKAKFGETHSEPFISRIVHALGYQVDPTDYCPGLRVKYDRRFFLEFNLRRPVAMRVGLLGVPLGVVRVHSRQDPFDFIARAEFKDGRTVSGRELKSLLLRQPRGRRAAERPQNFRPEVEAQLDALITHAANVQLEDERAGNIGPWEFGGFGREHRRELRGLGLLAAWLGWWDVRFDNLRLRLEETPAGPQLVHYLSDLGGGLGKARGTFRHSTEVASDFAWTFTRPAGGRGPGQPAGRVRLPGYAPPEDVPAFKEMTLDDARWMARLIGQLTEAQIVGALAASGFPPATARLYLEKLLSRRDRMVRDLGLADELGLLRPPARQAGMERARDGACRSLDPKAQNGKGRLPPKTVSPGRQAEEGAPVWRGR